MLYDVYGGRSPDVGISVLWWVLMSEEESVLWALESLISLREFNVASSASWPRRLDAKVSFRA